MRTKLRGKVTLLFMTLGLLIAIPAVALADEIQDELTGGTNNTTKTIATSGPESEFVNTYFIRATNDGTAGGDLSATNRCNVSSTAPAYVKIVEQGNTSLPSGVNATYPAADPNDPLNVNNMKFTACGTGVNDLARTKNVTFTGSTPGTYQLTASVSGPATGITTSQANFTLVVKKASQITGVSGSATEGGTATLKATLSSAYQQEGALSGKPVQFMIGTTVVGTDSSTDSNGLAELNNVTLPDGFTAANTYNNEVTASFAGDTDYFRSSGTGNLTVNPACTTPAAPVFATKGTDFDGSNGWFTTVPTVSASSTTAGAAITYATEVNGGTKSAYSDTAPTLGQGTTKVYAKATNGTCTPSETIDTFKVDTIAPTVNPANVVNNVWRNSSLSETFAASDNENGSGLADSANDASFTLTASAESADASTPTVDSRDVFDVAGNSTTRSVSAKIDLTNPTINGSASPAANGAGWNNTDVDVTFTCTDGLSDIASCGPDVTLQSEGADQSATGTATDNAGNSANATVSGINIDKTAPDVDCGSADGTWHADDVSIACTASDALSKLADSNDASFNLSTSVTAGTETSSAETNSRNVLDKADNSTTAGPIKGIKVDKKAPAFGACPTAGPFTQGSGLQSVGPISANDNGSGLDNANSTLTRSVDTSTIGSKTVTFTAKDNVANSDTKTCTYDVDYNFSGFFSPIDNKDSSGNFIINKAKLGSTIPVKFSLGGDQGLNIFEAGYPKVSAAVTCAPSSSADALEEYATATVSSLKYDSTANQYIYNWKTDPKYTVGTCRQLIVKLADGTEHRATFSFFK